MKSHHASSVRKRMHTPQRRRPRKEAMGQLSCVAFACGVGAAAAIASAVIFSLIALFCSLPSSPVSALGYAAGAIGFAAAGFAAGRRGHAALNSGILTACAMTLVSLVISLLPLENSSAPPLAEILARLGYAAVCVIFAIVGSNRR